MFSVGRFVTEAHSEGARHPRTAHSVQGTCGFVTVVRQGTSWHLGVNSRELKSDCGECLLDNNLTALLQHAALAAVPEDRPRAGVSRAAGARHLYASTQKLACCQTCAHGDLSQSHSSYLFFHAQDKDRCIETPATQPLELYLGFDFASAAVKARALAILKRSTAVSTGMATTTSASA